MTVPVVQIFGHPKCKDTRKAERWFKERRLAIQAIDLREMGLSPGELRSVAAQLGGMEALLNRAGPRFASTGLQYAAPDAARIEAELLANPLLLITPIVRRGADATAGYCPETWKLWELPPVGRRGSASAGPGSRG